MHYQLGALTKGGQFQPEATWRLSPERQVIVVKPNILVMESPHKSSN
jgi:hypothetical protein